MGIILLLSPMLKAQDLSLENLDGFQPQAGNWITASEVFMERTIDIHKKAETATTSKKRKRNKKKNEPVERQSVTFNEGTGILLNYPSDAAKDNLITAWEHGDIKLELQVMMPKGSNSGIYLQGRYEVQLLDSWGVENPKYGDIGGIYRNWEEQPDKMFLGVAPLTNAAKAPGLWQNLKIDFEAPKFDEKGNKIANAKFVKVELNGKVIHQNVEVPLPTGGPISKEEAPLGPLMIQGDHGPVAFRNIKVQRLEPSQVQVSEWKVATYEGEIDLAKDFDTSKYSDASTFKELDITQLNLKDNYRAVFESQLNIPKSDTYNFSIGFSGGALLHIDNELVRRVYAKDRWGTMKTDIELEPGLHDIRIETMKAAPWHSPRLGLIVSTESTKAKVFNSYDSDPTIGNLVSPIFVDVDKDPKMLRGFVFFRNDGEKLSHTVGVGSPKGVHFIYDLECGNLVGAWRGGFIDATPMWHNRGNGSFRPNGVPVWTFLNQPLAKLSSLEEEFPDNDAPMGYKSKGYQLDKTTKLPVFEYDYKGTSVTHKIEPDSDGNSLVSELSFSASGLQDYYYKLAEGSIKKLPDGSYLVNEEYYLELLSSHEPMTRTINGNNELMISIDGTPLKFKTIW